MFRRPHEKEYLWVCLRKELPWQHSCDATRLRSWERAAEAVATYGTIEVETAAGVHKVHIDLMDGKVTSWPVSSWPVSLL